MYYRYNPDTNVIIEASEAPFEDATNTCYSHMIFDLELNEMLVGLISDDLELLKYTVFVKPVEELVRIVRDQQQQINTLTECILEMSEVIYGA